MMNKIHVKTGDTVVILSGKDKGQTGKVLQVSPKEKKVIIEGRNIATKHVKPRREPSTNICLSTKRQMLSKPILSEKFIPTIKGIYG